MAPESERSELAAGITDASVEGDAPGWPAPEPLATMDDKG